MNDPYSDSTSGGFGFGGGASSSFDMSRFQRENQENKYLAALQRAQAYKQEQDRKKSGGGGLGGLFGLVGAAASAIPGVGPIVGPLIKGLSGA